MNGVRGGGGVGHMYYRYDGRGVREKKEDKE